MGSPSGRSAGADSGRVGVAYEDVVAGGVAEREREAVGNGDGAAYVDYAAMVRIPITSDNYFESLSSASF